MSQAKKTDTIIEIASNMDLVRFNEEKNKLLEKYQDNPDYIRTDGVAVIPFTDPNGRQGFANIPWMLLEVLVTEEEFKSWKFAQKIKT